MKTAIISDIHSNWEALTTSLDYIQDQGITQIWCLGDLVGYGANPNECVELIRERCQIVIAGNHDHAALNKTDVSYFNVYAQASADWTQKILTAENKEFLDQLPLVQTLNREHLVHATPYEPEVWHYVFTESESKLQFESFETQLCFIGHSHIPVIFRNDGAIMQNSATFIKNYRYLINIGSIGQPRDGNPKLSFAVYDNEKDQVEIIRLFYPVEKQAEKIRRAGLPSFLADRLIKGV